MNSTKLFRFKRLLSIFLLAILVVNCDNEISYEQQIRNYDSTIKIADSLFRSNNYEESIMYANGAIEITDTLPEAYHLKGRASFRLGWYEIAEENFDEVIEIEGEMSKAFKDRALLFLKVNDSDFEEDIDKYLKYYTNDEEAQELRREYFESNNDFEEAIAGYSIAIANHPDSLELYIKRSELYIQDQDYTRAMEEYDLILKKDPSNSIIKKNKSDLKTKLNNKRNGIIFILLLTGIYLLYLPLSFFVLKSLVIKKANNQIGGEINVMRDPLIWALPILLVVCFLVFYVLNIIPNF